MSLDYKLNNCENWEQLDKNMIYPIVSTMFACGVSHLDDSTIPIYKNRLRLNETLLGFYFAKQNENEEMVSAITDETIHRFKGIKTNVSSVSKAKWIKQFVTHLKEEENI